MFPIPPMIRGWERVSLITLLLFLAGGLLGCIVALGLIGVKILRLLF